jgi:hypothetical protein
LLWSKKKKKGEHHFHDTPPLKRCKLNIPIRTACKNTKEKRHTELAEGLKAIEKLIASKREVFEAGRNRLQVYRAHAIQSCLKMVLVMVASLLMLQKGHFAENWGGRKVCDWVKDWVMKRQLPALSKGQHVKSFSLLSNPTICAGLRSYLQSNK